MKLDLKTVAWIESAIGDMSYGHVHLVISDRQIVKVLTEEHRCVSKAVDKP